jgi:hypothetical protein
MSAWQHSGYGSTSHVARGCRILVARGSSGRGSVSQAVVAEVLARVFRDPEFGARLKADPTTELADLDLTDAERDKILAGLRSSGGGAVLDPRPRSATRIV